MKSGGKAVVVGMGFIGSEVAATLAGSGINVTALDMQDAPLLLPLGSRVASVFTQLHEEHGVELVMGQGCEEFRGDKSVTSVLTKDGLELECDFAVVGLGVVPNDEIAGKAALKTDNGILVDEFGRTSDENVFAAGDVARHFHPAIGEHIRVEHHMNALNHGAAVARSMMGIGEPYSPVHTFWSDQYDLTLDYAGHHGQEAEVHVRGSLEERNFLAFYVEDGSVSAVASMGRGDEFGATVKLLEKGTLEFSDSLLDLDQPLE